MSAIYGIAHFDREPVLGSDLARMDAALAHHGAEGGDRWLEGAAGLGQRQRRFTLPDASEHQPLASDDGTLVLVSDARLDNRDELLADLCPGIAPARDSERSLVPDSALILRSYQAWGADCLQRLAGVFAFALWDARAQSVFAARSPIMAPLLVYATQRARLAFATMPSALHALSWIPRRLDDVGLARLLTGAGGGLDCTIYRGITLLPTGHWLRGDAAGIRTAVYWRPDLRATLRLKRDADYLEAFGNLFSRVVGDHLAGVTPVAIQLSGGLDSSAVAAAASRHLAVRGETLTAFTQVPAAGFAAAVPKGMYADETPYVRALAGMHANIELNFIDADGQFFLDDVESLFLYLEAPFRNSANRVWIEAIPAEAGRRGQWVLLDGMQGNLTLSWNGGGWLNGLLQSGQWERAVGELRAFAGVRGLRPAAAAVVYQALAPLLPAGAWEAVYRLRHPGAGTADARIAMSAINPVFAAAQGVAEPAGRSGRGGPARTVAELRQIRYDALQAQDAGAYISAYRARYGVDMRSPTADVRLANFCLALPEEQFCVGGEARSLIRRAMAGQLPISVLGNRQRGMQAADWYERLVGARVRVGVELVRLEQSELAQRVLDLRRMREAFEGMPPSLPGDPAAYSIYSRMLQGGLMVGAFLRWFEAGA